MAPEYNNTQFQAIAPMPEVVESASATTADTSGPGFVPYIAFALVTALILGIYLSLGNFIADATGYIFDEYQSGTYNEDIEELVHELEELQEEGGYTLEGFDY